MKVVVIMNGVLCLGYISLWDIVSLAEAGPGISGEASNPPSSLGGPIRISSNKRRQLQKWALLPSTLAQETYPTPPSATTHNLWTIQRGSFSHRWCNSAVIEIFACFLSLTHTHTRRRTLGDTNPMIGVSIQPTWLFPGNNKLSHA